LVHAEQAHLVLRLAAHDTVATLDLDAGLQMMKDEP
jgi:hypothetical protein